MSGVSNTNGNWALSTAIHSAWGTPYTPYGMHEMTAPVGSANKWILQGTIVARSEISAGVLTTKTYLPCYSIHVLYPRYT